MKLKTKTKQRYCCTLVRSINKCFIEWLQLCHKNMWLTKHFHVLNGSWTEVAVLLWVSVIYVELMVIHQFKCMGLLWDYTCVLLTILLTVVFILFHCDSVLLATRDFSAFDCSCFFVNPDRPKDFTSCLTVASSPKQQQNMTMCYAT